MQVGAVVNGAHGGNMVGWMEKIRRSSGQVGVVDMYL